MDLLQRCVLVPLDIFKETMQNKPIRTLLEAWLTFLGEDSPQRLTELFKAFPQFIAMYETLHGMNKDMVSAMGFFSEELRIMDQNTVKYMIDEMDDELKRLESEKNRLEGEKSQLEDEKLRLETQNIQYQTQIAELLAEVQRLKVNQS